MRLTSILTLMMALLLWGAPSYGQEYNPDSPDEPGVPPARIVLYASPSEGGSVNGSGSFTPGASVKITANPSSGYRFAYWTDDSGEIVATTAQYSFTKSNETETFTANFEFDPTAPGEPDPAAQELYYTLTLTASEGGSVSGGGRYHAGNDVGLRAYANSDYSFLDWTNEDGEVVSTTANFTYTTRDCNETLKANFVFNPSSPTEPTDPLLYHTLTLTATEGGYCSFGSKRVLSGEVTNIRAYPNGDYAFVGWYNDGELISTSSSYDFQMGNKNETLVARFRFDPSSPGEPLSPSSRLSLFLLSEITYPGTKVVCPLFINSSDEVCDMTFNLAFPPEALPDWSTLQLEESATGYATNVSGTEEEGVYNLTLTGATLAPSNMPLFTVVLDVPETVDCKSYQVKINQVSITLPSGDTVTALTRNGRVYVYELGDNNGDGKVDLLDYVNMSMYLLTDGADNEVFIGEVADVNEDGRQDVLDTVNILEILMNK